MTEQSAENDGVQKVTVVVTCPACGSPDYEIDLDSDELGSHVSIPCEDCPARIDVAVTVLLQTTASASEADQ